MQVKLRYPQCLAAIVAVSVVGCASSDPQAPPLPTEVNVHAFVAFPPLGGSEVPTGAEPATLFIFTTRARVGEPFTMQAQTPSSLDARFNEVLGPTLWTISAFPRVETTGVYLDDIAVTVDAPLASGAAPRTDGSGRELSVESGVERREQQFTGEAKWGAGAARFRHPVTMIHPEYEAQFVIEATPAF